MKEEKIRAIVSGSLADMISVYEENSKNGVKILRGMTKIINRTVKRILEETDK